MDPVHAASDRYRWPTAAFPVLVAAVTGAASVGVARIPRLAARFGAGNACLAFTLMFALLAVPAALVEMAVAQRADRVAPRALASVHPRLAGLGVAMLAVGGAALLGTAAAGSWTLYPVLADQLGRGLLSACDGMEVAAAPVEAAAALRAVPHGSRIGLRRSVPSHSSTPPPSFSHTAAEGAHGGLHAARAAEGAAASQSAASSPAEAGAGAAGAASAAGASGSSAGGAAWPAARRVAADCGAAASLRDRGQFAGAASWAALPVVVVPWVLGGALGCCGMRPVAVVAVAAAPLTLAFMVAAAAGAIRAGIVGWVGPSAAGLADPRLWGAAAGLALLSTHTATGTGFVIGATCRAVHRPLRLALATAALQLLLTVLAFVAAAARPPAGDAAPWVALGAAADAGALSGASLGFVDGFAALARAAVGLPGPGGPAVAAFSVAALGLVTLAVALGVVGVTMAVREAWLGSIRFPIPAAAAAVGALLALPLKVRLATAAAMALDEAIVAVAIPALAAAECVAIGYLWPHEALRGASVAAPQAGLVGLRQRLREAWLHGVGRLQSALAEQGHGARTLAAVGIAVKVVVPLGAGGAAVAGLIGMLRSGAAASQVAALAVPVAVAVLVVAGAASAQKRQRASVWTDRETARAAVAAMEFDRLDDEDCRV